MRKAMLALALIALVPFAIGACGGDDDADEPADAPVEAPAPDDEATTVQVTADPDGDLAYVEDSLTASAGQVTIEFDNPSVVPHDVVVEDAEGNDLGGTEVIAEDSDSVTLDLEPGEYTFYCSVPGHREAGQEGPLTVE